MRGLVFKLLLKACVPLLLVVGAASYATYLKGGDPGAVLARVGDGLSARFARLGGEARDGVVRAAGGVTSAVAGAGQGADRDADPGNGPLASTEVRRWTDADGTVHYSNAPGAPVDARIVHLDPRTNVIIAVPPPQPPPRPPSRAGMSGAPGARAVPAAALPLQASGPEGAMPGIAGLLGAAPTNVTPEQAQALLRALQGAP